MEHRRQIAVGSLVLACLSYLLWSAFHPDRHAGSAENSTNAEIEPTSSSSQRALDTQEIKSGSNSPDSKLTELSESEAGEARVILISSGDRAKAPNSRSVQQGETVAISSLELQDAESAPGRRFPLSPSIAIPCTKGADSKSLLCKDLITDLEEFAKEPRNIQWARNIEERLESAIERSAPGKYSFRALECRTNWCVVEVASPMGTYRGDLSGDPKLDRELWSSSAAWQIEKSSGESITVSVFTFVRANSGYSKSKATQ